MPKQTMTMNDFTSVTSVPGPCVPTCCMARRSISFSGSAHGHFGHAMWCRWSCWKGWLTEELIGLFCGCTDAKIDAPMVPSGFFVHIFTAMPKERILVLEFHQNGSSSIQEASNHQHIFWSFTNTLWGACWKQVANKETCNISLTSSDTLPINFNKHVLLHHVAPLILLVSPFRSQLPKNGCAQNPSLLQSKKIKLGSFSVRLLTTG